MVFRKTGTPTETKTIYCKCGEALVSSVCPKCNKSRVSEKEDEKEEKDLTKPEVK